MHALDQRKRNALWIILFILLASSLAIPYLLVREPPLLDYPNHLARTFVLYHLHDPAFHFAEYYSADWKPYPYVLWDVLMVALQRVLRVEMAGKLLLTLSTILVPISAVWFLWQANRTEIKIALLACALSYYSLFFWGFVAYQLGVSFCFLMVGTWLWYRRRPSIAGAVLFAAITFATYFAHLMAFASAAIILVLYEFTSFESREWLRLAGFLAPPSLLFLWARPGLVEKPTVEWRPLVEKLRSLYTVPGVAYHQVLGRVLLCGFALCFLLAVVRNRELRVNRRWLVVAVAFFAVFLLLPYAWGETFDLDVRLVPPLCLLGLAVFRIGRRANWIAIVAVALVGLRVSDSSTGFQETAQATTAMNRGIEHVARNAKVFPLVDTCGDDDPLRDYYIHYWAYAVMRRGAISPYLFDISGQTPMRITYAPYQPLNYWDHCYDEQPDWSLVAADYDYVWSYGSRRYQQAIEQIAEQVFEDGPVVVYRVRNK